MDMDKMDIRSRFENCLKNSMRGREPNTFGFIQNFPKMENGNNSDSCDDTLTSSDSSGNESDEEFSDEVSLHSLSFCVQSGRSTPAVKSNKTKKRVQFKPGDSLVLVYEIPNREMLGLKSESEDSDDSGDSGDDSDDESDDDDSDDDDDDSDDDDEGDESGSNKRCSKLLQRKQKPTVKLISVKQLNKRPSYDNRNNRKNQDKVSRTISLNLHTLPVRPKKRPKKTNKGNEAKEPRARSPKKENVNTDSKKKQNRAKKGKAHALKIDIDKTAKLKRKNKPRLLEIKATVESDFKEDTCRVQGKQDLKPSIVDVNGAIADCGPKHVMHRTRLQPTSFRISKPNSARSNSASLSGRQTTVRHVVSASYDTLTSVMPESYVTIKPLENINNNNTTNEIIKRLDPDNMNAKNKRHYAWQVANGNISSQTLRTPSILPFWDSLQNSIMEKNTIKLPT